MPTETRAAQMALLSKMTPSNSFVTAHQEELAVATQKLATATNKKKAQQPLAHRRHLHRHQQQDNTSPSTPSSTASLASGRTSTNNMLWFLTASLQCALLLSICVQSAVTTKVIAASKDGEELVQCCVKMVANSAKDATNDFCRSVLVLNAADQAELHEIFGCANSVDAADAMAMEKRKPNFMRYGRSPFGGSTAQNFLRFGRSVDLPFSEVLAAAEKKSNGVSANFLRFGKSASDPNFLRFGKRAPLLGVDSAEPNFLRFGRAAAGFYGGDDIMAEKFDREYRKPNFLRFG